jgi:DnaJ-domain-containing protein 1
MSATPAGKFQDHYVVLGIDPKANSEAIREAYANLADRYRPGNRETGDPEKFEAINMAFEVLSDPTLRASFDRLKAPAKEEEVKPQFSGLAFFEALKQGADLRAAVLCILYDRRRSNPFKPSLSIRHLEGMLQVTTEELNFALWYLKQRLLVMNDDKSSLQITVDGMDYLEKNPPAPDRIIACMKTESVQQQSAEPGAERDSVLVALNRALTREPADEKRAFRTKRP